MQIFFSFCLLSNKLPIFSFIIFSGQSDASAPPSPKGHHRSQSDGTVMSLNEEYTENKKESDKKSVKNILSQLLPSSSTFSPLPVS